MVAEMLKIASGARAARVAESESTGLFMDIALKGDYTAGKTLPVTEGASVTFDDIIVGKKVYAEAVAYQIETDAEGNEARTTLYRGKTEIIRIKAGENAVTLVM